MHARHLASVDLEVPRVTPGTLPSVELEMPRFVAGTHPSINLEYQPFVEGTLPSVNLDSSLDTLSVLMGIETWEILLNTADGNSWDGPALERVFFTPLEKVVLVILATGDAFALHARNPF